MAGGMGRLRQAGKQAQRLTDRLTNRLIEIDMQANGQTQRHTNYSKT